MKQINPMAGSIFLLIFFLSTCIITEKTSAQINVTDNLTAQQLVQELVGENVAILNPVLTCPGDRSGTFETVNSNLNLDGGIVLSTGNVKTTGSVVGMSGPYSLSPSQTTPGPGDPQLSGLINNIVTNDACILEFDFVPDVDTASTLRFKYVFGSEEYPGYTCSQFNDVFGFLITGPGMSVPINIALVPGTTIPVAINSVNSGTASPGYNIGTCNSMGPGSPFPQYFVNNNAQNGQTITLDGFTTVLEATALVLPCDTYHMKLGVANASDHALQSAVFLKKNSFSVDTVHLNLDGIVKSDDGYLVEGCTPADIIALRNQPTPQKKKICLEYAGTAINGLDYTFLPDTIIIPANQTMGMLTLNPIQDNLPEPGYETVIIRRVNCCTKTPIDSVTIKIRDSLKLDLLSVDTLLCGRDSVRLQASGDSAFHFLWTATTPNANILNPTDSFTHAFPDTTTMFTITATYKSCPPVSRSFEAAVEPIPIVDIGPADTTVCLRDSIRLYAHVGPDYFHSYSYLWAPNNNISDPFAVSPKFFSQDLADYYYVLTIQTPHGCTGRDTLVIHAKPVFRLTDVTGDTLVKYGDPLQLNANGATYYIWSPGFSLDNPNSNRPIAYLKEPAQFTVYGINEYGCRDTAFLKVDIDYTMLEFIPSAFTPNGDGINDIFSIYNMKYQKLMEFRVFNRWGQQVFETNDAAKGWDGTYKGSPQESGTYQYLIRIIRADGQVKTYKGDVTLIR